MADNTDELPLEKPTNNQPENSPEEISLNSDTKTINSNQEIEIMEVHHHAHHEGKRNWKSYFWEFLMLFLAVFCGFLAEYQLEQTIERHREKEFIASMIEDAVTDTANIHLVIAQNTERIKHADSLVIATINYLKTQTQNSRIYSAARKTVYYPELLYPTDRTLFQLKNSGGMRLIRNKKSVESIIAYDQSGKNVVNQQAYYEHYLTALTEASNRLIDFSVLLNYNQPSAIYQDNNAEIVNPTREKLLQLSNQAMMFQGVMMQYIVRLQQMEKQAIELMNTLKKEYHLKN